MPTDDELKEFGLDGEERRESAPSWREIFAAQTEADTLYVKLDYTGMDTETAAKSYLAWTKIEELARER